jgi:hypothetical protein
MKATRPNEVCSRPSVLDKSAEISGPSVLNNSAEISNQNGKELTPELLSADDPELLCFNICESIKSDLEKALKQYGEPTVLNNPDLILDSFFSRYI